MVGIQINMIKTHFYYKSEELEELEELSLRQLWFGFAKFETNTHVTQLINSNQITYSTSSAPNRQKTAVHFITSITRQKAMKGRRLNNKFIVHIIY